MTTQPEVPLPETANKNPHSTRHMTVDRRFAGILHQDFPQIPAGTILEALEGEPQKQAIAILSWAERTDDPARALICWSRKHRRGNYRPGQRRHGETPRRTAPNRPERTSEGVRRGVGPGPDVTPPGGSSWGNGVGCERVLAGLARMSG